MVGTGTPNDKAWTWTDGKNYRADYEHDACEFGYRTSVFRGRSGIVLQAAGFEHPALAVGQLLHRVLQRHAVDHRGEHPHVVGAGAVHALGGAGDAAEDVPAADDQTDLYAMIDDTANFIGDAA